MRKAIALVLFFGLAAAAFSESVLSIDEATQFKLYQKYVQSETRPYMMIPFLGGTVDCTAYIYTDESDNYAIQEQGYEWAAEVVHNEEDSPEANLKQLMKKYKLSAAEEAVMVEWAKAVRRLGGAEKTTVAPIGSDKEKELTVIADLARAELNRTFKNYRDPQVRKKAFNATRLAARQLNSMLDQSDESNPAPDATPPFPQTPGK
jgi:hypothetical protein